VAEGINHRMPNSLIGVQHKAILDWLSGKWLTSGPTVCLLQGFPGVGKTQIADELESILAKRKPPVRIVRCQCPPHGIGVLDDLVLVLAGESSARGDDRLAESPTADHLIKLLLEPVLIVIDEFQESFAPESPRPSEPLAKWIEKIGGRQDLAGRILCLSSREVVSERWNERCEKYVLEGLKTKDGVLFLADRLQAEQLDDESLPVARRKDVVAWLGGFPRALKLLVSSLRLESLDDLIGAVPEAWEARNQPVSRELLRKIETEMVSRARKGLPADIDRFFERLAVFRLPVDKNAIEAIGEGVTSLAAWRDELLSRKLLDHRLGWNSMHPFLREAVLAPLAGDVRKRAHAMAAKHFGRHFEAKQIVGPPAKLGNAFIEARYHYTHADDVAGLQRIAHRFETYVRSRFQWNTPIPQEQEELNERIGLLSGLLQGEGAKSLHFHLARLLERRTQPGDLIAALRHADLGTGPESPSEAWLLRLRIREKNQGVPAAIQDLRRHGLKLLPPAKSVHALYQSGAALLARSGAESDRRQAIELLGEGIQKIGPQFNVTDLYQYKAELLSSSGAESDRLQAIELLGEGIQKIGPQFNLFSLYQSKAELLASSGAESDRQQAIELLEEGIPKIEPQFGVYSLYQSMAELLARSGAESDRHQAVSKLKEGIRRIPQRYSGDSVAEQALFYAVAWNQRALLDEFASVIAEAREFEPQQKLAQILECVLREDWEAGAAVGVQTQTQYPRFLAAAIQGAFCAICAGHPWESWAMLQRFSGLRFEARSYSSWLGCLIQVELGDQQQADRLLAAFLGRELSPSESADRSLLLRLWDMPKLPGKGIRPPCFVFPQLPSQLTKLPHTVRRTHWQSPVLPPLLPSESSSPPPNPPPTPPLAPTTAPWDPERILHAMRPTGWTGLYVVGSFERRITVFTEQARALTLVRALFDAGGLEARNRVGIVGGGAAGVTAAVAAATKGCSVTLYDDRDSVISLQAAAHHRFLHPHLYDWPEPGCELEDAGLPLLNWRADNASKVVDQLRQEFQRHRHELGDRLSYRPGSNITDVRQEHGERRVRLIGNDVAINEDFHVVLLAAGYGLERSPFPQAPTPSYWSGDNLDGPFSSPRRILVSGSGDGGLIDTARAAIRSTPGDSAFRHDHAVRTLTANLGFRKLAEEMQEIDREARRSESLGHTVNLAQQYRSLKPDDSLRSELVRLRRSDTEVKFNFRSDSVFDLQSSLLNRLLVHLLLEAGIVRRKFGAVTDVKPSPADANKKRVQFDRRDDLSGDSDFDLVILRYGPVEGRFIDRFPNLVESCRELSGKVSELRLTQGLSADTIRWYQTAPTTA
jgi:hypothetical protein